MERQVRESAMKHLLTHMIYEINRGVRSLALHTISSEELAVAKSVLEKRSMPYWVQEVSDRKYNIFLGDERCVRVISTLSKRVSDMTPEEDFILGTLLGYDPAMQCERYLQRKGKSR